MTTEKTEIQKIFPSVDQLTPDEAGGPNARRGFTYQDYIAAKLVFDMICDPQIVKIHCETQDDIVIVRQIDNEERSVEFVQVKAGELDKLWSLADIRKQKDSRANTSIFEKSLSRDKVKEVALFRIVTLREVAAGLKPLTYPCGHHDRALDNEVVVSISDGLVSKFPDIKSDKGNGIDYWLSNTWWEVAETQEAVRQALLNRVIDKSQQDSAPLLFEHAQKVLNNLLRIVRKAGDAKWKPDRDKKIICRSLAVEWWETSLAEETENRGITSGGKLRSKMQAAKFGDPTINMALSLRRDYISETRTPRYMDEGVHSQLTRRVSFEAMKLQAEYSAGTLSMTCTEFHSECLTRLGAIDIGKSKRDQNTDAYLSGCLYDITDRCLFTFVRQN